MSTPPSVPLPAELLQRKPGTVAAAQTMLWLQFSFAICCGSGTGFLGLFGSELVDFSDFGFGEDFSEAVEDLAAVVVLVLAGAVAVVVLLGVLAARVGAGRRWAQVAAVAVMLLVVVVGFLGLYTGFSTEEQAGEPVDGSRLIWTLLLLALPLVTVICLCTGSANQWFRQGGKVPLRSVWPPFRPY